MFADDVVIFAKVDEVSITNIMEDLHELHNYTGLSIGIMK